MHACSAFIFTCICNRMCFITRLNFQHVSRLAYKHHVMANWFVILMLGSVSRLLAVTSFPARDN